MRRWLSSRCLSVLGSSPSGGWVAGERPPVVSGCSPPEHKSLSALLKDYAVLPIFM